MKNKKYIPLFAVLLFCGSVSANTAPTSSIPQSSVFPSFQCMGAILGITTGLGMATGLYMNARIAKATHYSSPESLKTHRVIWGGLAGFSLGCATIGSAVVVKTFCGKIRA